DEVDRATIGRDALRGLPFDDDLAGVRLLESSQETQRRRLARAAGAEDREELAFADGEREAVHRHSVPVALGHLSHDYAGVGAGFVHSLRLPSAAANSRIALERMSMSSYNRSPMINLITMILSGGRGERLHPLTADRAKPAVPFGGKFRIIDFTLSNCMNSGIRRIGVVTQYKAHSLMRHIQRGWGFLRGEFGEFVELLPASQRVEETWYKGTADSIFQNLDIIRAHSPERVLVLAGDQVYKMDYGQMLAQPSALNSEVT